jgi:hypothetical protein
MDPRLDPATRYGFGSPEQQRAAREASAGARGARVATSPRSLYIPEGSFTLIIWTVNLSTRVRTGIMSERAR